jgi:hypothetical protein
LNPKEILNLIISKLWLHSLINNLINTNRNYDKPTQALITFNSQYQTSIIKLLDILFLDASNDAERTIIIPNNSKEFLNQIEEKRSDRRKKKKLSKNCEPRDEEKPTGKISNNYEPTDGVICKISGKISEKRSSEKVNLIIQDPNE